jgi:hypothetical protein
MEFEIGDRVRIDVPRNYNLRFGWGSVCNGMEGIIVRIGFLNEDGSYEDQEEPIIELDMGIEHHSEFWVLAEEIVNLSKKRIKNTFTIRQELNLKGVIICHH